MRKSGLGNQKQKVKTQYHHTNEYLDKEEEMVW